MSAPNRVNADSPRGTPITTTIIVPSYNEAEGLPVVLADIRRVIEDTAEILVVDDGSTDETGLIAERSGCRLVRHARNQGKGAAVRTGLREARGDLVIFIDADATYPAELIPRMLDLLEEHDLVFGSRARGHTNIPAFNRIGNAIFRNSIRYFYGFKPYDPLTGFFGARRSHLLAMDLTTERFRIESEIAIKAASRGLDLGDLPVEYGPRLGTAKLRGLQDGYTIFENILRMLPTHSPVWGLVAPALLVGLISLAAIAVMFGLSQSVSPVAFLAAYLLVLASLQTGLAGLLLLSRGVTMGTIRAGNTARILLSDAAVRAGILLGLGLTVAAVAWTALDGAGWRTSDRGIEAAMLAVLIAAAGVEIATVQALLALQRPARVATQTTMAEPASGLQTIAPESEEGFLS